MKKFFAIAAVVAVALTSCVKNEVITPNEEINFKAVNYKNTKAVVTGPIADATYPTTEHFGVYAFHSANSYANTYMNNVEVEQNGTYWKHATDSYYWPKDADLKFACYSPYEFGTGDVTATAANGVMFTGFKTKNAVKDQIDLMVSEVSAALTSGPVAVPFHHLLSQIKLDIKTDKTYTATDKVVEFKINSVTFTAWSTADYVADGTIAGGYWDNFKNAVVYDVLDGVAEVVPMDQTVEVLGEEALIIPQNYGNITVNYTIDYDGTNKVTTDYVITPTVGWERNKIYTYHITIGLDEIEFAPEVVEWDPTVVEESATI